MIITKISRKTHTLFEKMYGSIEDCEELARYKTLGLIKVGQLMMNHFGGRLSRNSIEKN